MPSRSEREREREDRAWLIAGLIIAVLVGTAAVTAERVASKVQRFAASLTRQPGQ